MWEYVKFFATSGGLVVSVGRRKDYWIRSEEERGEAGTYHRVYYF